MTLKPVKRRFKTKAQVGTLSAAMIAAAVVASLPIGLPSVKKWESGGKLYLEPYKDIAGVWTVCDGETRVEMRRYTPNECAAMTIKAYSEFGVAVLSCTPSIHDRPSTVAAAILLAYNIGGRGYCRSTVARLINEGDFNGACAKFYVWNKARVRGTLRVVKGLVNRRANETKYCVAGLRA